MGHLGNISWALFCGRRQWRRRGGQTRVHLISPSSASLSLSSPLPSVNHAPPYIAFRSVFDARNGRSNNAELVSGFASPGEYSSLPLFLLIMIILIMIILILIILSSMS